MAVNDAHIMEIGLYPTAIGVSPSTITNVFNQHLNEINEELSSQNAGMMVETAQFDESTHTLRVLCYETQGISGMKIKVFPIVIFMALLLAIIAIIAAVLGWISYDSRLKVQATNATEQQRVASLDDNINSLYSYADKHNWTPEQIATAQGALTESYQAINPATETDLIKYLGWATLLIGAGIGGYYLIQAIGKSEIYKKYKAKGK